MNELSRLRTETGKIFEIDPKLKVGQYCFEARTGAIHYKESYKDTDPWLDLDETYSEPAEIKDIGKILVYPKLPNVVMVFQDRCGYQIQSRSNPDHLARVELVSIDGQGVKAWQDAPELKTHARVHPYRVGIWKDFSGRERSGETAMRWKITELGSPDGDSHPFVFRESPEAFSTANLDGLSPDGLEAAKISIETARTRIDDCSWYWDESIPAEARLVDTDFQVAAGGDDGYYYQGSTFTPSAAYLQFSTSWYRAWTRFTNVTVEKNTTLLAGAVSFKAYANISGTRGAQYHWSDADNPTAPTSSSDAASRNRTYISSEQSSYSWTSGSWYSDIPSFINGPQAYLNKDYWASGKAMLFFYDSWAGTVIFQAHAYESASANAPKLTLTFNDPNARGKSIFVPNVSWLSRSLLKRREV